MSKYAVYPFGRDRKIRLAPVKSSISIAEDEIHKDGDKASRPRTSYRVRLAKWIQYLKRDSKEDKIRTRNKTDNRLLLK